MTDKELLRQRVADLVNLVGGQRALGERIGVDQSVISRYLGGTTGPSYSLAAALRLHYAGLKPLIEAVFWPADMQESKAS